MSIVSARQRVESALEILREHMPLDKLVGGKFLDIGCGTGNGVIAGLSLGARCAVGIDRDAREFGETYFEPLAAEFGVDSRLATLIQGDVFQTSFFDGGFDTVMMYDAIEHVPNPKQFINICGQALRPDGVALILTCPLYYSAVGHHLWNEFPEDSVPWVHLYKDFEQRLADKGVGEWGMQRYRELNKVTRSQLISYIADAGLDLVVDRSIFHPRLPAMLESVEHLIDWSLVPSREDLLCDYASLLFRRPTESDV